LHNVGTWQQETFFQEQTEIETLMTSMGSTDPLTLWGHHHNAEITWLKPLIYQDTVTVALQSVTLLNATN
jgi:hypothetical protein